MAERTPSDFAKAFGRLIAEMSPEARKLAQQQTYSLMFGDHPISDTGTDGPGRQRCGHRSVARLAPKGRASRMSDLIELPVDWFDSPEPQEMFTDNDLEPTGSHPDDYRGPSLWVEWEPYPDMHGVTCSTGFTHEPRRWKRPPVSPVGIANVPVPRHWENQRYD